MRGSVRSSRILLVVCFGVVHWAGSARAEVTTDTSKLPALSPEDAAAIKGDWLITPVAPHAGVYRDSANPNQIVLTNGLLRRTFRLAPDAATVALDNLVTGQSILRGVKPEASVELDGTSYKVGGLRGQPDYAYLLPKWLDSMTADPDAFHFIGYEVGKTGERFPWKRVRHAANLPWPPAGASLRLDFKLAEAPNRSKSLRDLTVSVHYELYDGIPLLSKWLTIHNSGEKPVRVNKFTSEILAMVEPESAVDARERWEYPNVTIISDYAFRGMDPATANRTTQWVTDPQFNTQVNFNLQTPCLLESKPPIGPDVDVAPGKDFESFRTFELIHDSTDRERKGLAIRRMYRTIAPWITENPIMMHVVASDDETVKRAIDQAADVGFEMVIMSFGSGLNMESTEEAYLARIKSLVDYAHSKKVELGGYSLLASRDDCGAENQVINAVTHKPGGAIFGSSPCIGSPWGIKYMAAMQNFLDKTGMDLLEHDGSYPGDVCASTTHPGHHGLDDSQWTQWKTISDFYAHCRAEGKYLNVPDFYFLNGSNKTGMGYREDTWSLPREQQLLHARQHIFDGTWEKTPSMGWMFVPLTQYHGGGAAATIEPLADHLDAYDAHLANLFGAGVQACYRGSRLYDADSTRAVVKKWVDFYKTYREILDSDLIHVRRADGRDIDCLMHVNPQLKQKGLAVVYNPLDQAVKKTIKLPLYYTGLTETAQVSEQGREPIKLALDRKYEIDLPLDMPAHSMTWFVIE